MRTKTARISHLKTVFISIELGRENENTNLLALQLLIYKRLFLSYLKWINLSWPHGAGVLYIQYVPEVQYPRYTYTIQMDIQYFVAKLTILGLYLINVSLSSSIMNAKPVCSLFSALASNPISKGGLSLSPILSLSLTKIPPPRQINICVSYSI